MTRETQTEPTGMSFPIRLHIVGATGVMALLVLVVGGWAATAKLSGAVIAPGTFVVEKNVKKVQHSFGGIVREINIKNGDRVAADQVLMRLDPTQIEAELGIINAQLIELTTRKARLSAERDNKDGVVMPAGFADRGAGHREAAEGEIRLFEEMRRTRDSQKSQLKLRIVQLEEEISGLEMQRKAKSGELALIKRELVQVRHLHEKKLTAITRVYAMEREETRLSGEHGGLTAQVARAKGQISEIGLQILAVDENARAQAQRELRAIDSRLSELAEREVAAKDKLNRIDIRAPQGGIVHELSVHTLGGVITAAEQIMLIVPEEDNLTIQARVSPADVDQIRLGGQAKLRLSAFSQQDTPELAGHVVQLSADITVDPKTGMSHYVARLEMDEKARRDVGHLKLIPGMPVEVYISTGERTALSYLAKPLTDQMSRAFRE
jgi:HlyD family secretion protein